MNGRDVVRAWLDGEDGDNGDAPLRVVSRGRSLYLFFNGSEENEELRDQDRAGVMVDGKPYLNYRKGGGTIQSLWPDTYLAPEMVEELPETDIQALGVSRDDSPLFVDFDPEVGF